MPSPDMPNAPPVHPSIFIILKPLLSEQILSLLGAAAAAAAVVALSLFFSWHATSTVSTISFCCNWIFKSIISLNSIWLSSPCYRELPWWYSEFSAHTPMHWRRLEFSILVCFRLLVQCRTHCHWYKRLHLFWKGELEIVPVECEWTAVCTHGVFGLFLLISVSNLETPPCFAALVCNMVWSVCGPVIVSNMINPVSGIRLLIGGDWLWLWVETVFGLTAVCELLLLLVDAILENDGRSHASSPSSSSSSLWRSGDGLRLLLVSVVGWSSSGFCAFWNVLWSDGIFVFVFRIDLVDCELRPEETKERNKNHSWNSNSSFKSGFKTRTNTWKMLQCSMLQSY